MNRITALKFWARPRSTNSCSSAPPSSKSDGSITGQVKEGSGAAVAGATVKIVNPTNSARGRPPPTARRNFRRAKSRPAHTVSVEAGTSRVEKGNVVLSALDKLNAGEFILEVGQVTERFRFRPTRANCRSRLNRASAPT